MHFSVIFHCQMFQNRDIHFKTITWASESVNENICNLTGIQLIQPNLYYPQYFKYLVGVLV